jgi:ABC-type dipeptide/oligopeptide/nickel transport system ATPase component
LGGGVKQRVIIAMALARSLQIVIPDERATTLDIVVNGTSLIR